ncbi:hypothetical protein F4782DRAFT_543100 [Xylaria castorea]|nr:hypothetical protein F4782DRAFT_543100 [Xylaria castorea]
MASTAVRFPVDNESQLPYWPDNDELPMTDNFFDQYVTFEASDAAALGGDVLEDPPSPSILLESLHPEMASSSSGPLDLPPDHSHVEIPARTTSRPIAVAPQTSSTGQIISDSALLATLAGEPVLNHGSISDSELLHLEGISLQSSPHRRNATTRSSPTFATSTRLSPQKRSRFVESVYATVRRAAHRLRPVRQEQFQPVDMTDLDAFLSDPRSGLEIFDVNFDELTDPTVAIKHEPIDCDGLPLSPPLTGRIPNERQVRPSGFVTGRLEDPFGDEVLGSPAMIQPARRQNVDTPMTTPGINGETFFHNQSMTAAHANNNNNTSSFRRPHKAYRSTSSAEWPTEGLLTDVKYAEDANVWSSASPSTAYVTDHNGNGNIQSPNWWDTPEISHAEPAHHHQHHHHHHHSTNGGGGGGVHGQRGAELPYEYGNDLISGLMIHMPQPRTPQVGVLRSDNLNEHLLATSTPSSSSYHMQGAHHFPPQHGGGGHNKGQGHGHGHHTDRRPRPRAPSSGARHQGPPQTSPRKLRNSSSMGYLREQSQSPSPMSNNRYGPQQQQQQQQHHGGQPHHQERRQQRSSSLAVRKQRSFSRRGGNNEPRTPSSACSTFAAATTMTTATTPSGGGGGGGGDLFNLDFVNFTPSDKNVLMTGVAPSGSSKTKARREKEALERAARLGEAALKVAGGDVNPGLLKELMRDFSLPDA